MTQKITKREFIKIFLLFLKENNVLKQYKKNLYIQEKLQFKTMVNKINPFTIEQFKSLFKRETFDEMINHSFIWASTKEGQQFWSKLDYKWREYIKKQGEIKIISEKIYD